MSQPPDAILETPPQRSAGRTIARNTAFGIGAQLALKVANSALTILIVRSIGDDGFGQYSIVFAWTALFSVIGDLGITQYLGREIARNPGKTNELFWDTVALRFILGLICTIVTVGGAILLTDYSSELILGFGIYCLTYFMFMFVAPFKSLLLGNERIDLISVLDVIEKVIFMAICALFLLLNLNFLWLLAAGVITQPFIIGLQIWMIRRNKLGPPRFHFNPHLWWSLVRFGLPFRLHPNRPQLRLPGGYNCPEYQCQRIACGLVQHCLWAGINHFRVSIQL